MQRATGKRTLIAASTVLVLMTCFSGNGTAPVSAAFASDGATARDPLNAAYVIQGERIRLRDGGFETAAAPGSASRRTVRVLGAPARGDLDGDGRADYALVIVDDAGGSGTFYHAAAGDVVRSPLVVEGRAQAAWFGDGLLSISLLDADGGTIARSHAIATENAGEDGFMGFRGTLEFPRHRELDATLVISEHHPNKGPEARQASRIPVVIP